MSLTIRTDLAAAFVLRRRNMGLQVLLLKRPDDDLIAPGSEQPIYGHLLENESPEQAVVREVHEETGLTVQELFTLNDSATFYEAHSQALYIVPFFAAFVKDDAAALTLPPSEAASAEWVDLKAAGERLIWPAQQRMLHLIYQLFADGTPPELFRLKLSPSNNP